MSATGPSSDHEVWLIAAGSASMVRLLDAAIRAQLIVSVVSGPDQLLRASLDDLPSLLLVDAAAFDGADALRRLEELRRALRIPIVVVDDRRRLDWCGSGATVVVPAGATGTVVAAQLAALIERLPDPRLDLEIDFGPFHYLHGRRRLEYDGQEIACTATQRELMVTLMRAQGAVVPTGVLVGVAQRAEIGRGAVPSHIRRLRRALERVRPGAGSAIVAIRGEGYRLRIPAAPAARPGMLDARPRDSE